MNDKIFQSYRLQYQDFTMQDVDDLVACLGEEISFSKNTLSIPYPYQKADAEQFIAMTKNGKRHIFRIGLLPSNQLVGAIGIHPSESDELKAELGYWIRKENWNQGIATEAISRIIDFSFTNLPFTKLYATHFLFNPASGRAMHKAGMQAIPVKNKTITKDNELLTLIYYEINK